MPEEFCINCDVLKEQIKELQNTISQLKQNNFKLHVQLANLQTELQQYKSIKTNNKKHNRLLCFLGIHDYKIEDMGYCRECRVCGKRQIRHALAPDGEFGNWQNNY